MPSFLRFLLILIIATALAIPALSIGLPWVVDKELARRDAQCSAWQKQGYPVSCNGDQ